MERIRSYTANEVVQAIEQNAGLLLVHFTSALASSCEFVRRELELLAPTFRSAVQFAEVELPLHDLELIKKYGIEDVPTLILFFERTEVERFAGVRLPEELKELLEAAVSFYGSTGKS